MLEVIVGLVIVAAAIACPILDVKAATESVKRNKDGN